MQLVNGSNIQENQLKDLTLTPVTETPVDPATPDADDPAIYIDADNPQESFVVTSFNDGGLKVYDLAGEEIQAITPENVFYSNVDIAYDVPFTGFVVPGTTVDLAITSDRANDSIAVFTIDPQTQQLTELAPGFEFPESIFGVDDGEATASGLATYNSLVDDLTYVFVSGGEGNQIAQLAINPTTGAADEPIVNATIVRMLDVPVPEGEDVADYQVEAMVVDRETGDLYVAQEEVGIWKYAAEPDNSNEPTLIETVARGNLEADISGLTIYYGEDGNGYLVASSSGDDTFAVYERGGNNSYLGNFAIEGVEGSEGIDITNVSLGDDFDNGLLVVQDIGNFKYISIPEIPLYEPSSFDPRNRENRINDLDNNSTHSADYLNDSNYSGTRIDLHTTTFNDFG
ncbi:phytase [Chondrocystis sp. NIES-4102]|nr:phytase [Chondrocystis sp. NIES-4102]